jgi:hypothetical protein
MYFKLRCGECGVKKLEVNAAMLKCLEKLNPGLEFFTVGQIRQSAQKPVKTSSKFQQKGVRPVPLVKD